jgi:hypothetical protein
MQGDREVQLSVSRGVELWPLRQQGSAPRKRTVSTLAGLIIDGVSIPLPAVTGIMFASFSMNVLRCPAYSTNPER